MSSTCREPRVPLCRDFMLRCHQDTSPSLCKGPMPAAFLPGGDRGRAGQCMQLAGRWNHSAQSNMQGKGRAELGKRIPVGHAAPERPLMERRGHLAAHSFLKKQLSRAKGNAQLGAHVCM